MGGRALSFVTLIAVPTLRALQICVRTSLPSFFFACFCAGCTFSVKAMAGPYATGVTLCDRCDLVYATGVTLCDRCDLMRQV